MTTETPIEFILSPRNSEDAAPPYWTKSGSRPQWRNIFSAYGHKEIQDMIDTGCTEPWVENSYNAWLKRSGRPHLINS